MPIGAFAERVGLTASALRFYDDADLLRPERVDPLTGYRLYGESQLLPAAQLRQLRDIGMPLPTIARFFTAGATEAARLIDDQLSTIAADADAARQTAETLKASLAQEATVSLGIVSGPHFAAAVDQILATTVQDPEAPVLAGVRLEASPDSISLTATDRYRLATRTLVPREAPVASWAGTLAGDDLRALTSRLRRSPTVRLEASERSLAVRMTDTTGHCRLLVDDFPDYRLMVGSLPEVTHRLNLDARQLLTALEHSPEILGLRITDHLPSLLLSGTDVPLSGTASGLDVTLWFELTTLYPAASHTLGNDLMIDLRGTDQPATFRSADDGDLTTLVMPCRAYASHEAPYRPTSRWGACDALGCAPRRSVSELAAAGARGASNHVDDVDPRDRQFQCASG